MVPMGAGNTDAWVASIASYIRSSFGNAGGLVTPADVTRVRAATQSRRTPWTLKELAPRLPRRLESQSGWKVTASHASETAPIALSARAWNSGAPQAPGMWFQIELPQPVMVTELEFDSPAAGGPWRRCGRPWWRSGRGWRAGAAPAGPVIPFPRGYRVEVSLDGKAWGKPVAEGKARGAHTNITFAPARAKFVRITQTDTVEGAPAGRWRTCASTTRSWEVRAR